MRGITPEQMHEVADLLFCINSDATVVTDAIYVLRTVADARTHEP